MRRVYPKAFCVPVVEDADPHENHDLLVQMVRDGDCLMTFIYGMSRNAQAIGHVYAAGSAYVPGSASEMVVVQYDDAQVGLQCGERVGGYLGPSGRDCRQRRVAAR